MDEKELQSLGWKRHALPGFVGMAGPLWTRQEEGGWAYGLRVQPQHLNPAGLAHGGALMTLMDHALSTLAWQACGRVACLTLQLDTHFLGAARDGDFVQVRGQLTRRTRGLLFLQGRASQGEAPVMQAQAIMKMVAAPVQA